MSASSCYRAQQLKSLHCQSLTASAAFPHVHRAGFGWGAVAEDATATAAIRALFRLKGLVRDRRCAAMVTVPSGQPSGATGLHDKAVGMIRSIIGNGGNSLAGETIDGMPTQKSHPCERSSIRLQSARTHARAVRTSPHEQGFILCRLLPGVVRCPPAARGRRRRGAGGRERRVQRHPPGAGLGKVGISSLKRAQEDCLLGAIAHACGTLPESPKPWLRWRTAAPEAPCPAHV